MNQLALATYQCEMGLETTSLSSLEPRQQSLLQSFVTILETPVQTIAKIVDGGDDLADWG